MLLVLIRRELTSRNFAHIIHIKKNKKNILMEQFLFHKIGINAKLKYLILYQVSSERAFRWLFLLARLFRNNLLQRGFFFFYLSKVFQQSFSTNFIPNKKNGKVFFFDISVSVPFSFNISFWIG